MNDDTFLNEIIIQTKNTVTEKLCRYPDKSYKLEVVKDTKNCCRIIIEWKKCMGELLVDNPDFAPYRYVSFNIAAVDSTDTDADSVVYCWLDSEGDSMEDIKQRIIMGLEAGFNYQGKA